ncbi:MAG TPA: hypothetical protein PK695_09050 [Chitinophagaceae bacterium]|jgi:hypothetical protein|nr:hypothetical protein [Chitinophagaceae bacterium]HNF46929.1 hypothetical protein [Chitinophagaceae bacterium]HNK62260.1 hypothetical protein [Chitinophagaceae bacterium]HNL60295.1 hypothetical protein [Chitinophagaceae bacterium]HNO55585.1 hypothetical protein [Chitinophagaceae bacterium]
MDKKISPSDLLAKSFLEMAKHFNANVELIKVLKSRTYKIGEANVLVRASSDGNRRYFFGINYITVEEIANLENPFIAFICGSVERTIIIPAKLLFKHLHQISHDRNGEYKINIDQDLNIVLSGRGNRLECKTFINNWNLLLSPPIFEENEKPKTVEESLHSVLQGRLLEIGNIRGYQTFCPDKSRKFNDKNLEEISTLKTCPELQFSDYDLLRQIDVIWFKPRGNNFIPEYAFEVELSTGVWSGVGRMATLMDYSNVGLYVIANDSKKYSQVINSFTEYQNRYKFIANDLVGELYSAELNLKQLRIDIGL